MAALKKLFSLGRSKDILYEPSPRVWPFSTAINGRLFAWGGMTEEELATNNIEEYDEVLESWRQLPTTGIHTPILYDGASAHSEDHLYMYGGLDINDSPTDSLYQLDMILYEWRELSPHSTCGDSPMKKAGSCMIGYKDSLLVCGGFGIKSGPPQPGSTFILNTSYTDGRCWTNELHHYDLKEGKWSSPTLSGTRPPPSCGSSLTKTSEHQAVLFGGSEFGHVTNSAYVLDLPTWNWRMLEHKEGEPCPVGRVDHAAVCINYGGPHPQLLVYGGLDEGDKVLSDVWVLDLETGKWKEIRVPGLKPRLGHCVSAVCLGPGQAEVTIFGGSDVWPPSKLSCLAKTIVVRLGAIDVCDGKLATEWIYMDVANNDQRGSNERVRDKMVKLCQFALSQSTRTEEGGEVRELEERLEESERRREEAEDRARRSSRDAEEAEERARRSSREAEEAAERARRSFRDAEEAEERAKRSSREVEEAEERARRSSREAEEAEERARRISREAEEAEERARRSSGEAEEAEGRARRSSGKAEKAEERASKSDAEMQVLREQTGRRVEEVERRLEEALEIARPAERRAAEVLQQGARQVGWRDGEGERQWLVEREEIHMTDVKLGGGGWGEVMVAKFREVEVAAKCFYPAIQTGYFRTLFVREMDMASRVRHPNLVQFIGACMGGGMVILMEMMPTSLRNELERDGSHLSVQQRVSISLDVSRALNYLHLMKPQPVIHRDISSANVLLEPLPNHHFRAKVTDYGSVNSVGNLRTENPGCPAYSAPEAQNAALQTPKMDIFSFGILLIEICTEEFPDQRYLQNLIESITDEQWLNLIRRCIHHDNQQRPTSAQMIAELETWQNQA